MDFELDLLFTARFFLRPLPAGHAVYFCSHLILHLTYITDITHSLDVNRLRLSNARRFADFYQ